MIKDRTQLREMFLGVVVADIMATIGDRLIEDEGSEDAAITMAYEMAEEQLEEAFRLMPVNLKLVPFATDQPGTTGRQVSISKRFATLPPPRAAVS